MLRRMLDHDYQSRCIYMITLCVKDRLPLLGKLKIENPSATHPTIGIEQAAPNATTPSIKQAAPNATTPSIKQAAPKAVNAYIEPTELGLEVERCWRSIPEFYPEVKLLSFQLMPDHLHGLLFVRRDMKAHLGQIVKGFKIGCSKAKWRIEEERQNRRQETGQTEGGTAQTEGGKDPNLAYGASNYNSTYNTECKQPTNNSTQPKREPLFEGGYKDSILMGKNQLERMFNYIKDNPRRLAVKRMNPDLFKVVTELEVEGIKFAAIGNRWLLDRPIKMQVRCHNNTTPENLLLIERQKEYFLERGKHGGVVVSPCISAGEKEIARAALDAGQPLIVILENGFPPLYKPPGKYFEACADGLLLMLAPWQHHMDKRKITRQQCLALNDMALTISTEPWTEELEAMVAKGEFEKEEKV